MRLLDRDLAQYSLIMLTVEGMKAAYWNVAIEALEFMTAAIPMMLEWSVLQVRT